MNWPGLAAGLCLPPLSSLGWWLPLRRWRWIRYSFLLGWLASAAAGATTAAAGRDWWWAAGSALSAAACLAVWWWFRRKDRKRAPRAYGAKSKARVAALARKARDAARPRPVLRPQPAGGGRG